jgi:Pvc16 N-terminal domain
MISQALNLLRDELNAYIRNLPGPTEPSYVALGNVAGIESDEGNALRDTILLSLVNIEEESALKNVRVVQKTLNGGVRYEHPPVYLNLYILFSANFPEKYDSALIRLSQTIRFFQSKRLFNLKNTLSDSMTAGANDPDNPERDALANLELAIELYTMTFEQINHLWGSLGGKQLPFVMYKVRLVEIREPKFEKEGALIEAINHNVHPLTENC